MKNARLYTVTWEVHCPYCGLDVCSPSNGSYIWTPDDFRMSSPKLKCDHGHAFRLVIPRDAK